MLIDKTVSALLDDFSSPTPTPGGGSAAALAGAIGASLMAMAAGLPKTKSGTPEARAALDEARAHLLVIRDRLAGLVDRDAAAYDLVVAAYKRPKDTDAEKAARKVAIQDAMRAATEVPIETMVACADATKLARVVADHGNPSAKSDMAVGVQLLADASQGALLNVEANIGGLTDPTLTDALTLRARSALESFGDDLRHVYVAAGILDLMKQAAQRTGSALHARRAEA